MTWKIFNFAILLLHTVEFLYSVAAIMRILIIKWKTYSLKLIFLLILLQLLMHNSDFLWHHYHHHHHEINDGILALASKQKYCGSHHRFHRTVP